MNTFFSNFGIYICFAFGAYYFIGSIFFLIRSLLGYKEERDSKTLIFAAFIISGIVCLWSGNSIWEKHFAEKTYRFPDHSQVYNIHEDEDSYVVDDDGKYSDPDPEPSVMEMQCFVCGGSGICTMCGGSGIYNNGFGSVQCQTYCAACNGRGYTVENISAPSSSSSSRVGNSGNSNYNSYDNSGGQTQRRTESHICRVCDGTGEEIKNVWMGSDVLEYCEKCEEIFECNHYHITCKTCGGTGIISY